MEFVVLELGKKALRHVAKVFFFGRKGSGFLESTDVHDEGFSVVDAVVFFEDGVLIGDSFCIEGFEELDGVTDEGFRVGEFVEVGKIRGSFCLD